MDHRVFRIVTTFEKPHPVLLGFPENRLYLISLFSNIYLGFSEIIISLWSLSSCSDIQA